MVVSPPPSQHGIINNFTRWHWVSRGNGSYPSGQHTFRKSLDICSVDLLLAWRHHLNLGLIGVDYALGQHRLAQRIDQRLRCWTIFASPMPLWQNSTMPLTASKKAPMRPPTTGCVNTLKHSSAEPAAGFPATAGVPRRAGRAVPHAADAGRRSASSAGSAVAPSRRVGSRLPAGGQRLGRLLTNLRGFQSAPGFNGRQLFALFGQHLALAG